MEQFRKALSQLRVKQRASSNDTSKPLEKSLPFPPIEECTKDIYNMETSYRMSLSRSNSSSSTRGLLDPIAVEDSDSNAHTLSESEHPTEVELEVASQFAVGEPRMSFQREREAITTPPPSPVSQDGADRENSFFYDGSGFLPDARNLLQSRQRQPVLRGATTVRPLSYSAHVAYHDALNRQRYDKAATLSQRRR